MKKLLIAVTIGLTFAAASASAEQDLQLSHNAAPRQPKAVGSLQFAELVGQKTNGRIKVEVGGSAQYGDDVESLTNMRLGSLAFAAGSQGTTSGVVPEFNVLGLPFLFRDLPHAYKVVDGSISQKLNEMAQKKVWSCWPSGTTASATPATASPITKPEDLAGLKLRTPPDSMTIDIFTALGANPTPLAFSELYIALQQGVVDGQENPLVNIYSSKLHEVQKYISFLYKYETTPLLASKKVWDKLSKEDQKAILEATGRSRRLNRQMSLDSDKELRQKLAGRWHPSSTTSTRLRSSPRPSRSTTSGPNGSLTSSS